ncbi:MAG: hypothetical protein AAGA03_04570 [Planctomycetota bacterium]
MIHQATLKVASVLMALVVAGLLVWAMVKENSGNADSASLSNEHHDMTLEMGSFGTTDSQASNDASAGGDGQRSEASRADLVLRVGRIGATPNRQDITRIDTLPIDKPKVVRAYRDSKDRQCRMLVPGATVSPSLRSRASVAGDRAGTFGRMTALTVGLEMSTAGREKLPMVTRGQVATYFRDHRLAIQPTLFHDEDGRLYFGTDCEAAFYEIARPAIALKPEPMIESAVSRFRSLGVVGAPQDARRVSNVTVPTHLGRTLAMAFVFEKSDEIATGVAKAGRQAYELLLLHLPENATVDEPRLSVYVTSNDRETLHRLDTDSTEVNSLLPTISAEVRFDKMVLMGLYPAKPVVTKIRYRSAGVLSMQSVRQLVGGDQESGLTVPEILDRFGDLATTSARSISD